MRLHLVPVFCSALLLLSCATAPTISEPPEEPEAASTNFELNGSGWVIDLSEPRISTKYGAVKLDWGDRVSTWVSYYEDGAGPVDLDNALSIMEELGEVEVLFQIERSGSLAYELVARTEGKVEGERLIDAPNEAGATVLCSFVMPEEASPAQWRRALEVCQSLRPVP